MSRNSQSILGVSVVVSLIVTTVISLLNAPVGVPSRPTEQQPERLEGMDAEE